MCAVLGPRTLHSMHLSSHAASQRDEEWTRNYVIIILFVYSFVRPFIEYGRAGERLITTHAGSHFICAINGHWTHILNT